MLEDEQREFLRRYKRNIREIIKKYRDVDDRYDSVISINEYEEVNTSACNDISFLRHSAARPGMSGGVIGFEEVYLRLCCLCDFDDIFGFLG